MRDAPAGGAGGGGGLEIATGIATGLLTTRCYSVVCARASVTKNLNKTGLLSTGWYYQIRRH
jgi:hypothetical protein